MKILAFAALLLAWPSEARAYVDPGSVSIFLQVVFAAVVGGALVFWNRLKELGRSLKRKLFGDRPPR